MGSAQFEYDFTAPGALKRRRRSDATVDEFAFDAAGQMTSVDGIQLVFDARGRLVRVTKADGTVIVMTYDYRGARVAKTVSNSPSGNYEVRYVDDLCEDRPMAGTAYVYIGGRLVGQRRGGGTRHLHTDHRASVVLVTKANGQVDGRAWFGPFGCGEPLSEDDLSREFLSAVLDHETGLCYFNHRYYSPSLGRFVSPDPLYLAAPERKLSVPQLHNLYAYARGDPIDYVDPTGLDFSDFISGVGKVIAGVVVVVAAVVAIAVTAAVIGANFGTALICAGVGALIGGLSTNSWTGAGWGAMLGSTAALNGPLGIINALAFVKDVRDKDWYKGLAGWSSWFMPASWPGHILGLGVFLGNVIAHVFGSDRKIESMKFDFKHAQIMTAGGEYGGSPFPWLGLDSNSINAHSVGGFMFIKNETWSAGGNSWSGVNAAGGSGAPGILEHETGHMLSNSVFGFWQGIVQAIETGLFKTSEGSRFFERVAESNVDPSERSPGDYGYQEPFWESERPPACPIPTPPSAFGKTSCP